MTSTTVLVVGIKLSLDQISEHADDWLSARLRLVPTRRTVPDPAAPKFALIHDGSPHSDQESYSLFLAWKLFEFRDELLTGPRLEEMLRTVQLSDPSLVQIPPQYNEILNEFDRTTLQYGLWSTLHGLDSESEMELYE